MHIEVQDLGKKFNRDWIFRRFTYTFQAHDSYTLVGPNGSGKSTLLQVLAGAIPASHGVIRYQKDQQSIDENNFFRSLVIAAPYLELIEEFSLLESIAFHQRFKPFKNNLTPAELAEQIGLADAGHKLVRNFSSGMKQRLKLGLAFWSDVPVIMLDEPTANLDVKGIDWYLSQIETHTVNRLVIICSNQPYEYSFCRNLIDLQEIKQ